MIAEFEADLTAPGPRGMTVVKAEAGSAATQPKLKPAHEQHLVKLWNDGTHTTAELADLFGVGRSTVYRALQRGAASASPSASPSGTN